MTFELPDKLTPGVRLPYGAIAPRPDAALIDAEIAAGVEAAGSVSEFVNNFADKLPGGAWRKLLADNPRMELPFSGSPDTYSERFLTVPLRQFFEDVDAAVLAAPEIDPAELKRFRAAHQAARDEQLLGGPELEAYLTYALPVYRELRLMGYNHIDLYV